MSHNAHSAPVKFKLTFGLDVEEDTDEATDVQILPEKWGGRPINQNLRDIVRLANLANLGLSRSPSGGDTVLGWGASDGELAGKLKNIVSIKLTNGVHEVWYVNESQYSNVGYAVPSFIAIDKDALAALQADVGGRIESDTTVMSWW